jgi:nucleotide-binding universal stress UspA family protein
MAAEVTIARTNNDALFFGISVLAAGLFLRGLEHRRSGLRTVTIREEIAAQVAPEAGPDLRINLVAGQTIMVAARGITPVLRYALEEARLRRSMLYVLYVKELAVALPASLPANGGGARWQDDPAAAPIMSSMIAQGSQNEVQVIPVYAVSDNPAMSILDLAATLGVDILMLGAPQRSRLVQLLKGNVALEVANNLPENIQLVIYG